MINISYYIIFSIILSLSLPAYSHSGRTNSEGCHAGTKPYHCHGVKVKNPTYNKPNYNAKDYIVTNTKTNTKNEDYYNDFFCAMLGGKREVSHIYSYGNKKASIKVDCETTSYVFEGGKDKRSSLDSVQQAIFFSTLTNKTPAVVIYNTDGEYGKYEHRIKTVAEMLGVMFILLDVNLGY